MNLKHDDLLATIEALKKEVESMRQQQNGGVKKLTHFKIRSRNNTFSVYRITQMFNSTVTNRIGFAYETRNEASDFAYQLQSIVDDLVTGKVANKELYKASEVATMLGIDRQQIYAAVKENRLKAVRNGKRVRIHKSEVQRLREAMEAGGELFPVHWT